MRRGCRPQASTPLVRPPVFGLILAVVWAPACDAGTVISGEVPALRVVAPTDGVEFGAPFPLAVVRTWAEGSEAAPFDPATLTPLVVDLVGTETRSDGKCVQETSTFVARAFVRASVAVSPWSEVRARDGSTQRVEATPWTATIRSSLAAAASPPELPGDILPEPRSSRWLGLLVLGAVALGAVLWFARRRHAPAAVAVAPSPTVDSDHAAVARARLAELRRRTLRSPVEVAQVYIDACQVLREHLAGRFALATREMTTEETLAALGPGKLATDAHACLGRVLQPADLVKFARYTPGAAQAEAMLTDAETFVDAADEARDGLPTASSSTPTTDAGTPSVV